MVYIASDGTVLQKPPWNLDRVMKFFYGIIFFVVYFFKSLVGLDNSGSSSGSFSSGSSFRGSGGGGGGGRRPGGPGGPGGGGPSKRFFTMRDINPPSFNVPGGCAGGSCGR